MTRTALFVAVAATLAIPALASAEPKSEAVSAGAATAATHAPRYCVVDAPLTGSRLEKRTCKSLDAWLAEGFDPRVKK